MQRVKLASALRAAIISIAFMRAAPVLADENKFVFVPQEDSPGNDYHRLDNSSFEDAHAQRPMDYSVYENIVYSYGIHVK